MKENSREENIKILKELGREYYKSGEVKIKALSGAKYIMALQYILLDYEIILKKNEHLRTEVKSLKEENERYQEIEIQLLESE